MKKYELTNETRVYSGRVLHRIRALCSFGNVKEGDLGGWIETEDNLSQNPEDGCWVYGDAIVCDFAFVKGNAQVSGCSVVKEYASVVNNARIFTSPVIKGFAQVFDDACVGGAATIEGFAFVGGKSSVEDAAVITGQAYINGRVRIQDKAFVGGSSSITETAYIIDKATIKGRSRISGNVLVGGDALIEGVLYIEGNTNICGDAHVTKTSDVLSIGPMQYGQHYTFYRNAVGGTSCYCDGVSVSMDDMRNPTTKPLLDLIRDGLLEAIAHAKGENIDAQTTTINTEENNIKDDGVL